ncbi:Bacilysin biosynthesis BacB [Gossypium arboreum]|uniref:Bacilysin biosynthesis BacB n=1 Tax=Gossypium arboreum TaxID=29729 RepID=A0A0B0MRU5_GOSAR|nr:Bacilysin biosynthesis BacB [Gossypium arboreum]
MTIKGGKMAFQMAYFCPHRQRHGRVSQPCVTHG